MQESKGVEIQAEIEKDVELCSTSYYYEDYIHFEEIREHARQIEKSIQAKEPRFLHRVLRSLPTTRKILTNTILKRIIHSFYTHSVKDRDFLLSYLEQVPGDDLVQQRMQSIKSSTSPLLPEVDVYFHLLLLLRLLDTGKHKEAADLSDALMQKVISQNRRSLDTLAARCYFYYQRSFELIGQMDKARSFLLTRLRTSTLRNDFDGQATLTNCLLRNYLHYNLYDQADKLASKAAFPESANNNEWSRYLYYIGRIKAIQLQYSLAYKNLQQAVQRAPQSTALGFKQIVQKMIIVVELLMGKIPERSVFRQKNMRRSLAPYFQLTLAIRFGDVQKFEEVVTLFAKKFRADNTYTLILRLRHNAIKTAIRYISLSYIKISLKDIAQKLMLDSIEEAEFVVAKAIRDGVIDAFIDEDGKFMQSREISDVYSTREPQISFHQRVQFCLDVHNQSIKAMRFPPKSCNKSYIKDSAGMDESSRITILEALAKTLSVELDHRRAGEDKLKVLELTDRSYGVHLAEISIDPLVRLPLRQLSSIVLRDYTNKHWSIFCGNFAPPKPSEESKVTIRRLLVIGLQEPDTKVKNAIAYALANVVKWDWPHDCPDLLDILLKYIRTENPDLVDGSMRVLLELAGVISDMQIPILGPIILQEVYKVFTDVQKYRLRIREMALDLFLTLYERICEVVFTNKSLVIPLLENILLQFSQALVMALQANDGPALDNHLRAKIFQVWTSIVLVSPKEVLTSLEEIMPTVISFVNSILNATDAKLSEEDVGASNDDGAGHPGLPLLAVLDFLYTLVRTPHLRHFVRAAIEDVLYYLLICMQIPNSQVENFLENVDSYIINEDSFDFKELVRNRAQAVLKNICKEFAAFEAPTAFGNAVMRLLEQATRYKNEGRHDWWKCLEVSMQSIGLVAPLYVGPSVFGKMGDQLVTFNPVTVVQSIFDDPMIRDAPPFLLGECIWAAGRLADILPEDLKRRVIKASVEALHLNQHHVMKVCGIRTIYDLCQHLEDRKQIAEILPYLPTLMNTLVGIANQYPEGEFLHLVLEVFPRLMVLDQAFTAASAPNFLPFLRDVFAAKTEDRTIIARIEEIIEKLVKIPEVLSNIQTILFPALVQLLQVQSSTNGNLKANLGDVFRMLNMILRASTAPLGEELLQPLPLLLRVLDETIHTLGETECETIYYRESTIEKITTFEEGVELLRAYIVTSPSQFCSLKDSEGRSALHYALELASNLLSPQTCERASIDVGLLVNTLVQTTGDQLAERKEILLRLVLNTLNMSKNFDVKQSLMMVFAHSVHTQFESVMDFLATFPGPSGTSALEFVLKEWVSMQKSFNGEFDIKISYIALANILQYGINSSDQRLVAIQVNDDEILCEETSVRTQAQKKETHVEHTPITLLVKIFKLLLSFMQSKLEVDSWSDEESGHESEIGGDASENFESEVVDLSTLLKEEDCNDLASVCFYAEVLQHPLYSVNLCVYLKGFISQFVAQGVFETSFRPYLNKAEKKTLRLLGINV